MNLFRKSENFTNNSIMPFPLVMANKPCLYYGLSTTLSYICIMKACNK